MRSLAAFAYLNPVFVWRFCMLIIYINKAIIGQQSVNLFSKMKTNVKDPSGFREEHYSKSAISCAISCQEKSDCQTFSFDKKTKRCRLGDVSIESSRMYKQQGNKIECPEQRGYQLWNYSNAVYCLKYHSTEIHQPEARQICEDDGGNLSLIDNDLKRQRLCGIYEELFGSLSDVDVWFDGYDVDDQNKFMSWKGEEIPGILWRSGQPENKDGEDCICARSNQNFELRDALCLSHKFPFFCEIELF